MNTTTTYIDLTSAFVCRPRVEVIHSLHDACQNKQPRLQLLTPCYDRVRLANITIDDSAYLELTGIHTVYRGKKLEPLYAYKPILTLRGTPSMLYLTALLFQSNSTLTAEDLTGTPSAFQLLTIADPEHRFNHHTIRDEMFRIDTPPLTHA
jgi:hypothetical protein